MKPEQKLIIEACLESLRATMGNMPAREADALVGKVISILSRMINAQL